MADLSRKTASIYINHQAAEDALKALQTQADKLQQKIKAGEVAGKSMVTEIGKLNKVTNDIKAVQTQIDNGLRPSFNQLTSTVSRLRNELKRMSEDAPGYAAKFKAFNSASTELQRMQTAINGVQTQGSLLKDLFSQAVPIIGFAAVTAFFKGAVTEALDAERATSRLKNTLDNLGETEVFDRLMDKADEMAARFKFIDNDDVTGVFEQLVTYGKLTEKQINDLTPVIINFAAKSRISLAESTSVIIKALEGNGKALKEYGINIKDAGTESERLAVIMGTLKDKVDGAADAFGETTQGKIASTQQEFKNLKEEIGNGLLPALNKVLSFINSLIEGASIFAKNFSNAISDIRDGRGGTERRQLRELVENQKKDAENFAKKYYEETQANKSLKEQQQIVRENLALYEYSKKELLKFQLAGGAVNEDRLNYLEKDLQLQKAIYDYSVKQLAINSSNAVIGSGGNNAAGATKKVIPKNTKTGLEQQFYQAKRLALEELDKLPGLFGGNDAQAGFDAATKKRLLDLAGELEVAKGRGRLDAKLKILDTERLKELLNTELTEKQKDDIRKKYDALRQQTKLQFFAEEAQQILDLAKGFANVMDEITKGQNSKDEAKIAQLNKNAEAERDAARRLLDGKIIDQQAYDKKIKAINDRNNIQLNIIEKREFERQKRMSIINAVIGGAQGIVSTLAAKPGATDIISLGAFRAIQIGLVAATTAAQIAAISSQKYVPKYERGGVLDGPSHSRGGMPVINPVTGRKVAEMEGGEAIISKRAYANNRALVDALLVSSMYGGGKPIMPAYFNRPFMAMNLPAVNNALNTSRKYERGGVFQSDSAGGNILGSDIAGALRVLTSQLAQPIRAYTVYSDINVSAELDNKVKSETTFTRN